MAELEKWKIYNETDDITLLLDTVQELNTGLPTRIIEMGDTMSDVFIQTGTGKLGKRTFTCGKVFLRYDKPAERQAFLREFLRPIQKKIYLYKMIYNENDVLQWEGRVRVYNMPDGGEAYANAGVSDTVSFSVECEKPFFESTTLTQILYTSTSKGEKEISVSIDGDYAVPCKWTMTLGSSVDVDFFRIANYESQGVLADFSDISLEAGDEISIDVRDGEIETAKNGSVLINLTSANSSPFPLDVGAQDIFVYIPAGTLTIEYNERRV